VLRLNVFIVVHQIDIARNICTTANRAYTRVHGRTEATPRKTARTTGQGAVATHDPAHRAAVGEDRRQRHGVVAQAHRSRPPSEGVAPGIGARSAETLCGSGREAAEPGPPQGEAPRRNRAVLLEQRRERHEQQPMQRDCGGCIRRTCQPCLARCRRRTRVACGIGEQPIFHAPQRHQLSQRLYCSPCWCGR
jgi:hypothetical protein